MNKVFTTILLLTNLIAYGQTGMKSYQNEIKTDSIRSYVYTLASKQMEGRETGKKGNKIAAEYIASIFRTIELDSLNFKGYFQKFDISKTDTLQKVNLQAQNVIAFIKGYQNTKETIVISAHYDHLGKKSDSTIYFGADDNASGVAAMIEIARVVQIASKDGIKPKRNILFIAFDGEEKGMLGSRYFINQIPDTIGSIILNISLDMVGRNRHDENKYSKSVFMISNGKNSRFYKRSIHKLNKSNENLIVSKYPLPFSNGALKSFSDHYIFSKKGIPFVHLQTGMHSDYHSINDIPDKINYEKLTEICKLLYSFICVSANTDKDLKVYIKD